MNNIKLVKAKKRGWFLTIGDDDTKHRLVVTSLELWVVKKLIEDNINEIMEDMEEPNDPKAE